VGGAGGAGGGGGGGGGGGERFRRWIKGHVLFIKYISLNIDGGTDVVRGISAQ